MKNNPILRILDAYDKSSYIIQKRAHALVVFIFTLCVMLPPVVLLLYINDEHSQTTELFFSTILIVACSILSLILINKGRFYFAANIIVFSMLFSLLVILSMTMLKYIRTGDLLYLKRMVYYRYYLPAILVVAMLFCHKRWIFITTIILVISTVISYVIMRYKYGTSYDVYITSLIFSFASFVAISIIAILNRKITDEAHEKLEDYIDNLELKVQSRTEELKYALDEKESMNLVLKEKTIELQKLKEQAEKQARTDALTGLNNRLAIMEYSIKEIKRAIRYNHALTLIMADIDHFKAINDTYGHAVGDKTLQAVASVIVQSLRVIDFPARIGGEEFAIILPETDLESAVPIAGRIRALIEKSVKVENNPVTCSFGIGTLHKDEFTIDTLLSRADEALYAAKNNGRNRVEVEAE